MYPGTHAANNPNKLAYVMAGSGESVTYRELNDVSNQLAQLLWDRGLRPGDGIAISMENNTHYLKCVWAPQRSGLYYTCINYRLTASEVEYILNDCGAKVFITTHEQRKVAAELVDKMPNVHTKLMIGGTIEGYESFEEVVGGYPAEPIAEELEGSDMLYSSGTTGRPKGVRPPLPNAPAGSPSAVLMLGQMLYGFSEDSIYLSPAPMYHAAPLRFTMAIQRIGGTSVIMEHFDPVEFLKTIEEHKVTHTQVVPTMFVRLLKLDPGERTKYDTSSLQTCIHAAAPCPIPVKEQMIDWWGPVIHEYYAGTEGNGFCACNSEEWMAHKGTVGKPLVGQLHVCDEEGEELPIGTAGTIYFEGGATFVYHNDPEKTKGSRDPKDRGWTTLGDVGYVDDDGFLYLTDRKAYMIISGGVNIYPQEAENVLVTHPKVMDVAVFGVPNEEMGEEVKAVVQLIEAESPSAETERELIAFCKEQLASYKCPRSVDFVDELPRHPTGKLYKRLLRDQYWGDDKSRIV
ncbi:MAG: AMP-binding protein [Acidimicrobiales bacterium]